MVDIVNIIITVRFEVITTSFNEEPLHSTIHSRINVHEKYDQSCTLSKLALIGLFNFNKNCFTQIIGSVMSPLSIVDCYWT